jgi:hypothetical protein
MLKGISPGLDNYASILAKKAGESGRAPLDATRAQKLKKILQAEAGYAKANYADPTAKAKNEMAAQAGDIVKRGLESLSPEVAPLNQKMAQALRVSKALEKDILKHYKGNFAKFTQNPDLKQKLLNSGGKIYVECSPYDKIWGNEALMQRIRKVIQDGGGLLTVSSYFDGNLEMKSFGNLGKKEDMKIYLPASVVVVVDVVDKNGDEVLPVEIDDDKPSAISVNKDQSPEEIIAEYNAKYKSKVKCVSSKLRNENSPKKYVEVVVELDGNTMKLSKSRLAQIVSIGSLSDVIRNSGSNKKYDSDIKSVTLNDEQNKIKGDAGNTTSDKIRKLYKSGMTVADIHRTLGIHYSFAHCVVHNYRKSFPDVTIKGKQK